MVLIYIVHTPGDKEADFQHYMTIPLEKNGLMDVLRSIMTYILPYKVCMLLLVSKVGSQDFRGLWWRWSKLWGGLIDLALWNG
jgi:hypothetical protein